MLRRWEEPQRKQRTSQRTAEEIEKLASETLALQSLSPHFLSISS
jgi:hypothetical protein